MTKLATETTIHTIGLDIAKNSFSVHGVDVDGHTVLTKDLKRGLTRTCHLSALPPQSIVIPARM